MFAKITTIALLASCGMTLAQNAKGCHEKSSQFDFWIGEWEVTANGKVAGKNSIQPILGGCVLQETWTGASGGAGTSFNYYNPSTKKWHQFWVWKNGTTLPLLTGEYENGKMVLSGQYTNAAGKKVHTRITWYDNEDGTVRQHWENSLDEGKSWSTNFDGLYTRKP